MGSVGQMGAGKDAPKLEEVIMYVKAGVDGERMGACPFCQRVFMVLLIKAQQRLLTFKVSKKICRTYKYKNMYWF